MSFKDIISKDIDKVFFNVDEFGEFHQINKQNIKIIIDNETLKERNAKEYDGILQADLLYYIKKEDLIKKPKSGEVQLIDDEIYTIFDVKHDLGVYEIILQAGRN